MASATRRDIAMIFQDPMLTLNPVLRIDTQIIEAIRAHADVSAARQRVGTAGAGRSGHSIAWRADAGVSAPVFRWHAAAVRSPLPCCMARSC